MANPYALDFSPVANALAGYTRAELDWAQQANADKRLRMEEERHPLQMRGLQLSNDAAALGYDTAQKTQRYTIEQARLGNEQAKAAIAGQGLTNTTLRQQIEDHAAKQFGGVMQVIQDRLKADPTDAWALNEYRRVLSVPDYKATFQEWGINENDPQAGTQLFIARGRGFQDPVAAEAKRAEIDKDKAQAKLYESQAESGNYIPLPENSRGVLDKKKGVVLGADTGDNTQRRFDDNYAKEVAPKAYQEASKAYADANDAHMTYKTMLDLAPYAKTGFTGPVPPEAMLTLRKIGASMGILNADTIAPTEIYKVLAQKGVFELTKSLKPASNLDMIASEKATASLQSDPTTLPIVLPMLMRIQERSMMLRDAEMRAYRSGRPPDTGAIMAEIDRRLPLMRGNGGQGVTVNTGPPSSGPPPAAAPAQGTAPPSAPPATTGWTPEDLNNARPGQKTPNGKYIFGRDGKLHPVDGEAGSETNPHEIGLFSGPTLKDGEFAIWNGRLYRQHGSGFGSLRPVER